MIKVYTDGACSGNGKEGAIGGWAFCVIGENDELIHSETGAEVNTTNNRMEFTAMLRALQWTEKNLSNNFIEYYTDSALLYNTLTQWIEGWKNNGWKRKTGEIKNLDLVKQLYEYSNKNFNHVRGHNGDKDENSKWNEYVDKLAVRARKDLKL
mgnify:FL=1